jgi:hypothetical protein
MDALQGVMRELMPRRAQDRVAVLRILEEPQREPALEFIAKGTEATERLLRGPRDLEGGARRGGPPGDAR